MQNTHYLTLGQSSSVFALNFLSQVSTFSELRLKFSLSQLLSLINFLSCFLDLRGFCFDSMVFAHFLSVGGSFHRSESASEEGDVTFDLSMDVRSPAKLNRASLLGSIKGTFIGNEVSSIESFLSLAQLIELEAATKASVILILRPGTTLGMAPLLDILTGVATRGIGERRKMFGSAGWQTQANIFSSQSSVIF